MHARFARTCYGKQARSGVVQEEGYVGVELQDGCGDFFGDGPTYGTADRCRLVLAADDDQEVLGFLYRPQPLGPESPSQLTRGCRYRYRWWC